MGMTKIKASILHNIRPTNELTNYMQQSPLREAKSSLASQEISHIVWSRQPLFHTLSYLTLR